MMYFMNKLSFKIGRSKIFFYLIVVFILYSLIGDYFRIMLFNKSADIIFDVITTICIIFFCVEIIFMLNIEREYFLSFYFFLDIICLISIVFDLTSV